jgi:hypothetical protein
MADRRFQLGKKHLHDLPDTRQADSKVVVDQDVAEAGDSPPIDLRPGRLQRLGQSLAGLGQRLEVAQDSVLGLTIRKERLFSFGDVLFNSFQTFADVDQIEPVALHSGTAS